MLSAGQLHKRTSLVAKKWQMKESSRYCCLYSHRGLALAEDDTRICTAARNASSHCRQNRVRIGSACSHSVRTRWSTRAACRLGKQHLFIPGRRIRLVWPAQALGPLCTPQTSVFSMLDCLGTHQAPSVQAAISEHHFERRRGLQANTR